MVSLQRTVFDRRRVVELHPKMASLNLERKLIGDQQAATRKRARTKTAAGRRFMASSPEHAEQQGCQEDHDENEEQDLCNLGCATRDAAKAEKGGDDCDDEEYDSVSKHEALQRVDYRNGLCAG